ncbi:hypothetical protein SETIT_9G060900v2 [Setaria italica]|nr:hypothetical protein SETIT_9G060900v2 [Setaria italica]
MVPISVVAADGDLLLVHMVVAVKGVYAKKFPHNFFVYKADPELPSLLPLPPPPSVWKAQAEVTGIARRGEEFVVANLRRHNVVVDATTMTEVEAAVVWLYRSSSATGQWETKQLDLPYAKEEGIVEYFWCTDTVFSFRGFPGIETWRGDRDLPNMYRAVSICRGHLKFVDIDNGNDDEGPSHYDDNYDGCTITTWTLRMPELEWEEDSSLLLQDLSSLPSYQDSPLPRTVPRFPVGDMEEDSILHFIKKSLVQYALYENPIEAKDSGGFDYSNVFFNIPFVSTQLFH